MDFTFNAAAGVAAAATGAHVNGSALTTEVVRLGALAGLISSGIVNFCSFVTGFTKGTLQFGLTICMTSFGLSFLVVFAIGQRALDEGKPWRSFQTIIITQSLITNSSLFFRSSRCNPHRFACSSSSFDWGEFVAPGWRYAFDLGVSTLTTVCSLLQFPT